MPMREKKILKIPPAHKHGIESLNNPNAKVMWYKNRGMIGGNLVQGLATV